ncbi:MAG TPA: glutamate mutase L, partial [Anaerolineales bacterium]|nr:glutamate mutase L [Anaerolineales bacterium]
DARSTAEPPFSYMGEGLRQAMDQLVNLTGRLLADDSDRLIIPSRPDGAGIDSFAASASVGKPLRTVLVGLMPNISLASAERVATSAHVLILDRIGLGDRRKKEKQIDSLLNAQPELVIIAGGTDYGSQGAVLGLADTVAAAARRLREGSRPEILFIGNAALHEQIKDLFTGLCEVTFTENVRPSLEEENIASARRQLARIYEHIRLSHMAGYAELAQWSGRGVTPNAVAMGNLIRHISEAVGEKAILGVDVGSTTTTLAAAIGDDLALTVRADLGVGHSAAYLNNAIDRLARWVPESDADEALRNYLSNKSLNPATVPHELSELYLEHALARQCLQNALQAANWPAKAKGVPGLLPRFGTIIGAGAVLARAPKPGQAALMLIDGLQPTGVTSLVLDWQSLVPMLGAAAANNPVAVVQVLEAGALLTLGTVVGLVGEGRTGQVAARVKGTLADGKQLKEDVHFGSIAVYHLPPGESKITIQPAGGFDAGFGRGTGKTLTLSDSPVGLIVDARGRPIAFPSAAAARHEAVAKWCASLGQYGL